MKYSMKSLTAMLATAALASPLAIADELPSPVPGAAQFLKKYPDSDLNKDGILTSQEKEEFSIAHTIELLGGNYTYEKVMVPMRDGVKLATGIFKPNKPGKFDTMICRTAYSIWAAAFFDTHKYANRDYVYICQDLRGDGESEGAGTVDLMSFDNEIQDGYDTFDWIIKQGWSNQRIGIFGQSGHGFSAYMAYLANHPNLVVSDTNVSGGNAHLYWTFHNGVRREMHYRWMSQRGVPVPMWPKPVTERFDRAAYAETIKHAQKDNQAVFVAKTGWYDIFAESALDYFEDFAQDGHVYIQVDASGHGGMRGKRFPGKAVPAEWTLPTTNDVMADADSFRKGKSRMVYYLMGAVGEPGAPGNDYKVTDVWPVPHDDVSFYVHQDGSLSTDVPSQDKASLSFKYDPRDPVPSVGGDVFIHEGVGPRDQRELKDRKDILHFSSAPLSEPMEITGKVTAELYVSSDVEDTTFTAKLVDIYPDGFEAIIRDSIVMGRFHEGLDKEVPMEKGKVYKLDMDLWSTAYVINKGHKIGVQISSSNSIKYDVHPNTFHQVNNYVKSPVATNTIHLSAKHPTNIKIPVVKAKK